MAVYTVYVPDFGRRAPSEADRYAALPDAVFVREGFSRAAFFLGPFWLAWHRLWGVLLVWFALFGLLTLVAPRYLGDGAIFWIALLLEFLLGLEGNALRQGELARSGFRLADIAAGIRRTDAERSYFRRALRAIPPPLPPVKISDAPKAPAPSPPGEIVGLFPRPEDAR
ncbi:MAG: DUF2628 domain-containing protein [Methylovirgula sp.]|nr:DUF2628 domain-containing protein [Methylovirgula sp.]